MRRSFFFNSLPCLPLWSFNSTLLHCTRLEMNLENESWGEIRGGGSIGFCVYVDEDGEKLDEEESQTIDFPSPLLHSVTHKEADVEPKGPKLFVFYCFLCSAVTFSFTPNSGGLTFYFFLFIFQYRYPFVLTDSCHHLCTFPLAFLWSLLPIYVSV